MLMLFGSTNTKEVNMPFVAIPFIHVLSLKGIIWNEETIVARHFIGSLVNIGKVAFGNRIGAIQ